MPGDRADVLYYMVDGSLSVVAEDDDGRELILAYLNKGEFIGELGLFVETSKREVLVRTRSACELAEISYERLLALFETTLRDECPKLMFAIGSQLTRRLLHTSRKVSRLAFMDVTGRISRTLLDLCSEPDALTHPQGTQIRVSRQELSRIVGCSREMAGRVLKQLEEPGQDRRDRQDHRGLRDALSGRSGRCRLAALLAAACACATPSCAMRQPFRA